MLREDGDRGNGGKGKKRRKGGKGKGEEKEDWTKRRRLENISQRAHPVKRRRRRRRRCRHLENTPHYTHHP